MEILYGVQVGINPAPSKPHLLKCLQSELEIENHSTK